MMPQPSVLFVIPPGWPELVAHHEATSGMGALTPGPKPFLYPPHVVATCAAVTRAAGMKTAVLDLTGARLSLADARSQIASDRSDVLGVLVSQGTARADAHFLRVLRQTCPERKVLLFGPSAHFVARPWLDAGLADAALLGEPEGAIAQAVARVAGEGPVRRSAKNVAWSHSERLARSPDRSQRISSNELSGIVAAEVLRPDAYDADGLLADLDALPFPAWDLVPWQAYGAISLLSSRGCPAGCAYCAYTVAQGHRFRAQSPERTVAELAWLAKTFQPPRIQVRDPIFAHDRARVAAICEGVLAKGLKLNFACESRPEHFDNELLRLLKAAGCTRVKIGLESGDPALLQRLNRVADAASAERTIAATQRVARTCHTLGITCQVFVMAGLPGQDAASLARTAAVLRRLPEATRVRAKAYQSHPGVALDAPTAIVPAETLAWLERANQPRPALWRRAYHQLKHLTSRQGSRSSPPPLPPRPPAPLPPRALSGQRAFLTGGNGFVGGHVARALVAAGVQVVALVRPDSPLGALADLPVETVRGDLREPADWAGALRGCDLCFNVAALYGGIKQADAMYAVNADGTDALLAACAAAGVRRVVHTSTVGTVGRPADPRTLPDETTPFNLWGQASHYVRSKYLGELIARSWGETGLEVVIVKPTAPVGAGDDRPSATGKRILAALNGQVTSYPPGGVNHVPVKDVALGILLAAERGVPGRIYILGHRAGNLDQAAFLHLVAEVAGTRPLRPTRKPAPGSQLPPALTVDPARAIAELGLPQSDLHAAFAEAVAWYKDQIV